jgi:hypothetical protein
MIRPLAVLVVATAPAWSADFAERWPQPIAVDPAAVVEPAPIAVVSIVPRARPADICSRHRMHKVITRGGRSWHCSH